MAASNFLQGHPTQPCMGSGTCAAALWEVPGGALPTTVLQKTRAACRQQLSAERSTVSRGPGPTEPFLICRPNFLLALGALRSAANPPRTCLITKPPELFLLALMAHAFPDLGDVSVCVRECGSYFVRDSCAEFGLFCSIVRPRVRMLKI